MPGRSDAVQTVAAPRSYSGSSMLQRPRRQAPSAISKVAWRPNGELDHSEWLATGRRLGVIGRCSQWWIGDWIRYGTSRWGEKYAEAARITGYDVASLRNMAWVASRFDSSLRNDKLSWSHHVLLAPLDSDVQRYWLKRAVDERLSVADLRLELRALREAGARPRRGEAEAEGAAGAAVPRASDATVCPHCGHALHPA